MTDPVSMESFESPLFCAMRSRLREAGLRPTRQRVELGGLLFSKGNRHISAEQLHGEASERRVSVSLATVYNTLRQFTEAGLLREVHVDGSRTFFDTNTGQHHHFYVEDEEVVMDVPDGEAGLEKVPTPPPGYEISGVDVVVRLRRIESE